MSALFRGALFCAMVFIKCNVLLDIHLPTLPLGGWISLRRCNLSTAPFRGWEDMQKRGGQVRMT
ncbi:hypothetical protein DD563_05280 [Pelagicola sp. LXJ1103]|nr:hypothetical protein DD563_05280 [Pelagicola sp. LXJ1103]